VNAAASATASTQTQPPPPPTAAGTRCQAPDQGSPRPPRRPALSLGRRLASHRPRCAAATDAPEEANLAARASRPRSNSAQADPAALARAASAAPPRLQLAISARHAWETCGQLASSCPMALPACRAFQVSRRHRRAGHSGAALAPRRQHCNAWQASSHGPAWRAAPAGPNRGRAPALRPSGSAACRGRRTLPSSRREPSLLPLKA